MSKTTVTNTKKPRKNGKPPGRKTSRRGRVEGRKPFVPTERQRQIVRALAVANYTQVEIAKAIRNPDTGEAITKPTLEAHFREELDLAFYETAALVVSDFMRKCTGASAVIDRETGMIVRDEVKSDTKAQIFFLSARLKDQGWSTRVEHTGKNGGAIPMRVGSLNDSQLDELIRRLEQGEHVGEVES